MRKTVTIPAAGETLKINAIGKAVFIEQVPVYPLVSDVPLLQFELDSNNLPIYPDSYYNFGSDFNYLTITGTSESAGDELSIVTLDECRESDIRPQFLAAAGTSFAVTTTDAAQQLTELQIINAAGQLPKKIVVSALNNPVIYAFKTDPDRANDFGHILHKNVITGGSEFNGSLLEIEGLDFILNWHFASAAAGSPAELTITCEY